MVDKLTKEGACNGLIVKVVPNDDIMSSISVEPDRSVRNGHVISVFSSFCKCLGRLAGTRGAIVDVELGGPLTDTVMNLDKQILEASVVFNPLNRSRKSDRAKFLTSYNHVSHPVNVVPAALPAGILPKLKRDGAWFTLGRSVLVELAHTVVTSCIGG